jgi:hypothetical protein
MQPVEVLTPEDHRAGVDDKGGLASAHGALCHRGGKGDHGTEGGRTSVVRSWQETPYSRAISSLALYG